MSTAVSVYSIEAILLVDGWHEVEAFYTHACILAEEEHDTGWGSDAGFTACLPDSTQISGPLSSLLAVRWSA